MLVPQICDVNISQLNSHVIIASSHAKKFISLLIIISMTNWDAQRAFFQGEKCNFINAFTWSHRQSKIVVVMDIRNLILFYRIIVTNIKLNIPWL